MEIVKFKNGKFGIRKRTFFDKLFYRQGTFRDFHPTLSGTTLWRNPSNRFFYDCQTYNIDEARELFYRLNDDVVECVVL